MKKLKYVLYGALLMIVTISKVNATPSYSFKVSSSKIEDGSKVTASVTVSATASWNIKIASAGNTSGCTNSWADASSTGSNITKTFSVTCRASSTGTISFTLSGDITDESGSNITISGSKRVTVVERHEKSTVNTLKSLSVDGASLIPDFDSETLEYTVSVAPTTTKVTIDATKKDSASSITGTGEFDVNEGENKFEVIVTSESGDTRTYTINVNVEDANPIKVAVNGSEYSLLKTSRSLEIPSLYTESSMEVEGESIPIFINEITNITLVALKDTLGNTNFFIYKDNTYTPYIELTSENVIIMPTNETLDLNGFKETSLELNNATIKVYQYSKADNNYYLLTGKNLVTNEDNIYVYNKLDNTYTIFDKSIYDSIYNDYELAFYFLIIVVIIFILCLLIIILQSNKNRKVQRLIKSLEEKLNKEKNSYAIKQSKKKINNQKDRAIKEVKKKKEDESSTLSNIKENKSSNISNIKQKSNIKEDNKSNSIKEENTEKADALINSITLEEERAKNKKKTKNGINKSAKYYEKEEKDYDELDNTSEKTYNILDD